MKICKVIKLTKIGYTAKRKLLRVFSLGLTCAVLLCTATNAGANTNINKNNDTIAALKKRAETIQKENKEREAKLGDLKKQTDQAEAFVAAVEVQIKQVQAQVDAFTALINAKQANIDHMLLEIDIKELELYHTSKRIEQNEREIERLDEENETNIRKFGDLIAQMYMNSGSDTYAILTGSTSFFDVLVRTEMIKNIGERNTEFMLNLLDSIKHQEDAIVVLQEETAQLEVAKAEFEEQCAEYEKELAALEDEKKVVTAEINRQYSELHKLTSERNELQKNVENLQAEVEKTKLSINGIMRDIADLEAENKRIEEFLRLEAERRRKEAEEKGIELPVYSSAGFIWPVERRFQVTGFFGWCSWRGGMHNGVDFTGAGIGGTNIYAVQSGTVIKVTRDGGYAGGYGNHIMIDHGGGYVTLYAHLQTGGVYVSSGDFVEQGKVIGLVGSTGFSTGNHLHFEVRKNGRAVDPMPYLR